MQATFTLEQKQTFVANLFNQICAENEQVKAALDHRDILLFRSFRLAYPELFDQKTPEQPICMESLKEHFKNYLIKLSEMGFLTYYLD
jgi:hypothetical protein